MSPAEAEQRVAPAVYEVTSPAEQTAPLVVSSPHSGRDYPPEFLALTHLDPLALRRSEDSFVDELFAAAPACGAPLLKALFPRAYLDLNREPYELDPGMFEDSLPAYAKTSSPRVKGGLGTIARIVADGAEIYPTKLPFAEAQRRIEALYRPYHAALARLTEATKARFGFAILLDCHSMPPQVGPMDSDAPVARLDVVLGDCYGTSCGPHITATAQDVLKGQGYVVRRNDPYPGGFITQRYGRPHTGVHALQIEVNRALYLDQQHIARGRRFAAVAAHMRELMMALARVGSLAVAAE